VSGLSIEFEDAIVKSERVRVEIRIPFDWDKGRTIIVNETIVEWG